FVGLGQRSHHGCGITVACSALCDPSPSASVKSHETRAHSSAAATALRARGSIIGRSQFKRRAGCPTPRGTERALDESPCPRPPLPPRLRGPPLARAAGARG